MSLRDKLEDTKLEITKKKEDEKIEKVKAEIETLDQEIKPLADRGARISALLEKLLNSYKASETALSGFKSKSEKLNEVFNEYREVLAEKGIGDKSAFLRDSDYANEPEILEYHSAGFKGTLGQEAKGLADVKDLLRAELPELDLKFSGGKKGEKSNREIALEKINAALDNIKAEILKLEEEKKEKYLATPEGQKAKAELEANSESCRQEVMTSLSRPERLDRINSLELNPRILDIAGKYGVELTQAKISTLWKQRAEELLFKEEFSKDKERIHLFAKYKDFTDNKSEFGEKYSQLSLALAELKTREEKIVSSLAKKLKDSPDLMGKFKHYGMGGYNLRPEIEKYLRYADELLLGGPEKAPKSTYNSPTATAYEYLHHTLSHFTKSRSVRSDAMNDLLDLSHYNYWENGKHSSADVYADRYQGSSFNFSDRSQHNPDFLLAAAAKLDNLLATLEKELDAAGSEIDPKAFISNFGESNYDLIKEAKEVADLSRPEAKLADFPREYMDSNLSCNNRYYEDRNIYDKFAVRQKQLEAQLDEILAIRWLEEEQEAKYNNNLDVWKLWEKKTKIDDYLKMLLANKDEYQGRSISLSVGKDEKVWLLDRKLRQEYNETVDLYRDIEAEYKAYLEGEIILVSAEKRQAQKALFNRQKKLEPLEKQYALLAELNSKSLDFGSEANYHSLPEAEEAVVKGYFNRAWENRRKQDSLQREYQQSENNLFRLGGFLPAYLLKDYPELKDGVATYEDLVSQLKNINHENEVVLGSFHSNLVKDFIEKHKEYQEMIVDYNRKYSRYSDNFLKSQARWPQDFNPKA